MTVVRMTPSELRHSAVSCRRIAIDGAAVARQVKALPIPHGVPPEAVSDIHDAMNQLQRSAIATERQAIFLLTCADRGVLADGPLGIFAHIGLPSLLSPWPMPAVAKKKSKLPWGLGLLKGAAEEIASTGKGLIDLGVVAMTYQVDRIVPGLGRRIPYAGEKRRQFDEGMRWAFTHPKQFFAILGKDTIAYKEWSEHKYAEAIGHNVVGLGELLLGLGKAGKLSLVEKAAKADRGKAAAGLGKAAAESDALGAAKAGRGIADRVAAREPKPWEHAMRERRLEDARQQIETARQRLAEAERQLAIARESHNEAFIEAAKKAADVANEGLIKVSTQLNTEELQR